MVGYLLVIPVCRNSKVIPSALTPLCLEQGRSVRAQQPQIVCFILGREIIIVLADCEPPDVVLVVSRLDEREVVLGLVYK